ncbi:MAG: YdiU family protein [Planctomycetales bacterium]|nr:YdiU family protein [Planctomycetales bacterium]
MVHFRFDNSYAEQLSGFYVQRSPDPVRGPALLLFNRQLAGELGLEADSESPLDLARLFSGNELPSGAVPLAQAYAGHQFGGFVPQLGDGRALLLGEVLDVQNRRRDIALKGSGPTAFARGGDGKAAVGPVLREYLLGEAMHALGIPTTRGLAAVATGEPVFRERPLPGAVLTRVASSHIRVGTFQFFAARQRFDQVQQLADYVIARHFPELLDASPEERYLDLLEAVARRQASLLARWMLAGFVHGVMNTDNMAVSGETIDYGPCAFMEAYDPSAVFSSIDRGGRYAYENQPLIARWNLARLAETLLPLINPDSIDTAISQAANVVERFMPLYEAEWCKIARAKLGLAQSEATQDDIDSDIDSDIDLARDWLKLLQEHAVDFTLGWRRLADAVEPPAEGSAPLFPTPAFEPWLARWRRRLNRQPGVAAEAACVIRSHNPLYIPRNHLVEEALAAATDSMDLLPLERLLEVVTDPCRDRPAEQRYAEPASREFTACYRTFCGT